MDRQTNRQTDKQTDRQTVKQTDSQTDRQPASQTDKQTDRYNIQMRLRWSIYIQCFRRGFAGLTLTKLSNVLPI